MYYVDESPHKERDTSVHVCVSEGGGADALFIVTF